MSILGTFNVQSRSIKLLKGGDLTASICNLGKIKYSTYFVLKCNVFVAFHVHVSSVFLVTSNHESPPSALYCTDKPGKVTENSTFPLVTLQSNAQLDKCLITQKYLKLISNKEHAQIFNIIFKLRTIDSGF